MNRAGFVIHSAIHRAKPELHCVAHTHTWPGMAISALECGLIPNTQTSMRFGKISYHDFSGVVLDLSEQARLVRDLGDNNAMILRNHGLLTTGHSIGRAVTTMSMLIRVADAQLRLMASGGEIHEPKPEVCEHTALQFDKQRNSGGKPEWAAILRKLDRVDQTFRD